MTTKELIELLNTFPSDVNVEVSIDMSKGKAQSNIHLIRCSRSQAECDNVVY